MVSGSVSHTNTHDAGKYLAIDCEMVGIGIDGSESSLARVTLVNYHGVVILDEFVKQRERVVDYRTRWSGVREGDMVKAKSFEEIQKQVAGLIKDRVLVGHAVHNDLKVGVVDFTTTGTYFVRAGPPPISPLVSNPRHPIPRRKTQACSKQIRILKEFSYAGVGRDDSGWGT